ncbi:TPA: hypothetical protein ACT9K3_000658 [Legionella pneumophila]|nr:hypothetical protein [Legionella pneumophila]
MDSQNIDVRYRPIRIGWCINKSDLLGLREALEISSILWGGFVNPILPIDDPKLAESLLNSFKVDILFPVVNNQETSSFIRKFNYIGNECFYGDFYTRDYAGDLFLKIVDIWHIMDGLTEEYQLIPERSAEFTFYQWDSNDSLSDVFLSSFGRIPNKKFFSNYKLIIETDLNTKVVKIRKNGLFPDVTRELPALEVISDWNLTYKNVNKYGGIYVGSANSTVDIINFWNLKAAGAFVFFYDPQYKNRFKNVLAKFTPQKRTYHKNCIFYSNPELLNAIDFNLNGVEIYIIDEEFFKQKIDISYVSSKKNNMLVNIFQNERNKYLRFQPPDKPFKDETNLKELSKQRLILSIKTIFPTLNNETIIPPYIPELNDYYSSHSYLFRNKIRVETNGIGIVLDYNYYNAITLNVFHANEIISAIFESKQIGLSLSQAGRLCNKLINFLGGLEKCKIFKIAGVRELINKYKVAESFTKSDAKKIIFDSGDFAKYRSLFIEDRDIDKDLNNDMVFDFLVKKRMLRVGLQFRCPECNLKFWMSIDESRTQITCEYCGEHFDISNQLSKDSWMYRKSGLLNRDNNQEGAIPVVLVLEKFLSEFIHTNKILYTTAMNLKTSDERSCETDFIILLESNEAKISRVQIIIGECKSKGNITQTDVNNLISIADILKTNFDVYILCAKLCSFTENEIVIMNNVGFKNLILLTQVELESELSFFDEIKYPDLKKPEISLDDLVHNTTKVYFRKQE